MKWKEKEQAIRELENRGKVNPNDLITAARDPAHPCHTDFTWDLNKAAAERWRDQARALIRQCKFEVLFEDVTHPVVNYVASPDHDSDLFVSLPKMRSQLKTSAVMSAELSALLGHCSRTYGIALAKQNIVGTDVAARLAVIRDQVSELHHEQGE
jgi:hypothetical protein